MKITTTTLPIVCCLPAFLSVQRADRDGKMEVCCLANFQLIFGTFNLIPPTSLCCNRLLQILDQNCEDPALKSKLFF